MGFSIRPLTKDDRPWVIELLRARWAGEVQVAHGKARDASVLQGFAAEEDGEALGLATYETRGAGCELVTLDSLREDTGIGTALVTAVANAAYEQGCRELAVVTTNDNTRALRFYQRRGFVLRSLRAREVEKSRRIKPDIPQLGNDDIPLRDELELVLPLTNPRA